MHLQIGLLKNMLRLWNTNARNGNFYLNVTLIFDTDPDIVPKEKVLPQRKHIWNIRKLYYLLHKSYVQYSVSMLSFRTVEQTDS